jgi:hypothetical protein
LAVVYGEYPAIRRTFKNDQSEDAMANDTRAVYISLQNLTWQDSKKSSTSPFLWTAFFTIDINGVGLTPTPGNHRDLGVSTVHQGAIISIPETLGFFGSTVTPFPFRNSPIGIVGFVAVLLKDGGHITGHGIQAGHDAFNAGVSDILQNLLEESVEQGAPPTQDQIEAAMNSENLPKKIKSAIENAQNFWDNLWAISGADSLIGNVLGFWEISDFAEPTEIKSINLSFDNSATSNWTFTGDISVVDQCPATTSASFIKKEFVSLSAQRGGTQGAASLETVLDLMRDFRNRNRLLSYGAFAEWWELLKRYTPELACRLATSTEAREAMVPLIDSITEHLKDDAQLISQADINIYVTWAESIRKTASYRLSQELSSALAVLRNAEGHTLDAALKMLSTRSMLTS